MGKWWRSLLYKQMLMMERMVEVMMVMMVMVATGIDMKVREKKNRPANLLGNGATESGGWTTRFSQCDGWDKHSDPRVYSSLTPKSICRSRARSQLPALVVSGAPYSSPYLSSLFSPNPNFVLFQSRVHRGSTACLIPRTRALLSKHLLTSFGAVGSASTGPEP